MSRKLPVDELLRLTCIYAERDQLELLDAWEHCDDADSLRIKAEIRAFVDQLRAYRRKRWGKTKLEAICEEAKEVDVRQHHDLPPRETMS